MNYLAILATIQLLTQKVKVLEAELTAMEILQIPPSTNPVVLPYLTTPQNASQVNIGAPVGGVEVVPAATQSSTYSQRLSYCETHEAVNFQGNQNSANSYCDRIVTPDNTAFFQNVQ